MVDRLEGCENALTDASFAIDKSMIKILPFSHEIDDVMKAIKELTAKKKEKPDAILFTTSKVGVMGLQCLNSLKLKIPDDIAIVSFDDPDAFKISQPPITAIAQPLEKIGRESVKILLEKMHYKIGKIELGQITLKTKFVVRDSSKK